MIQQPTRNFVLNAPSKTGMKYMENREIDLQELAAEVLESIEAGDDYYEKYQQGFGGFVGYSVEAIRNHFESTVEDMRDYSEPDHEDWVEFFGKIEKERHDILISQPSLATNEDLGVWIESNEESANQCICSAAGVPLTSDADGPTVVIGIMGDSMDPEIFLVSISRQEAEKTWGIEWILNESSGSPDFAAV